MHIVGAILGALIHHPLAGFITVALVAVLVLFGAHAAPDKIGERVDHRSAEKFKQRLPYWVYADRMRQLREEARRENEVMARWAKPKRKARKLMNSSNPKKQQKGRQLFKDASHWERKDMSIVHHAAKSARVHHDGTIKKGIRRD